MTFLSFAHENSSSGRSSGLPKEFDNIIFVSRPRAARFGRLRIFLMVLIILLMLDLGRCGAGGASAATPDPERFESMAGNGPLGEDFLISETGTGENMFARESAVAQGADGQMLVVWAGNRGHTVIVEDRGDRLIYGRLVDSATGKLLGDRDIVISPSRLISAEPDVTFNVASGEYFVVWSGSEDTTVEEEIWGRRLSADGVPLGSPVRLTHVGPERDSRPIAQQPAVAHTLSAVHNRYLVVWSGSGEKDEPAAQELDIYGVYVDAQGQPLDPVVRLSHMGPDGDAAYQAVTPDVVYNFVQHQFLVVWRGEDSYDGALGEWEIYGRHMDAVDPYRSGYVKRLTHMGPDGATGYDALSPALAFRPDTLNPEYLLVWSGDKEEPGKLANNEYEIFGRRLRARNDLTWGSIELQGAMMRISHMGPDGDADYDAFYPAVTYNLLQDAYMATWVGKDGTADWQIHGRRLAASDGTAQSESRAYSDFNAAAEAAHDAYETAVAFSPATGNYLLLMGGPDDHPLAKGSPRAVYAQLVDGSSGGEIGANDFIVSDMRYRTADYISFRPQLAYDPSREEYLAVWTAVTNENGMHQDRLEIYGQRIDAHSGALIGQRFPISDLTQPQFPQRGSFAPAVAYSPEDDLYLVAWRAVQPIDGVSQSEIWGARIAASDGQMLGSYLRISFMGPDKSADHSVQEPDVVYNALDRQFLVVWSGLDDRPGMGSKEFEVYGQHVASDSGKLLGDNVRISFNGTDGDDAVKSSRPTAVYAINTNEYFVAWQSNESSGAGTEVYGRRLDGAAMQPLGEGTRYSFTGPDGSADYNGHDAALAYNAALHEYLLVWTASSKQEATEVRGRRIDARTGTPVGADDFVIGTAGPAESYDYSDALPDAAYDEVSQGYAVIWSAEVEPDQTARITSQYLTYDGRAAGEPIRLNTSGESSAQTSAAEPAVAAGGELGFLTIWSGAYDHERIVAQDSEIFGRLLGSGDAVETPQQSYRTLVPLIMRQ